MTEHRRAAVSWAVLTLAGGLAACAAEAPPADPAVLAANDGERIKLAALARCHAEAERLARVATPAFHAAVDDCMAAEGYGRTDAAPATAGLTASPRRPSR